jgi:hypothetical protein
MNPKWLIENFDADNNTVNNLINEVKRQGLQHEIVKYLPFGSGKYDKFSNEDCVIYQGSINLAQQLIKEKHYIPGPWLTATNYECTTYYSYLGKYLFNNDYLILPRAEVLRKKLWLYNEAFNKHYEQLFFRPNSGLKPFTAKLFNEYNDFDSQWSWIENFTEPNSLIIISTPKIILAEYRFICAEYEIISGCQYRKNDNINHNTYTTEALELAKKIAAEDFQPDPMFTIDICYDGNYHLLEINSFSCAGLYTCPLEPIITTANKIALKEWTDVDNIKWKKS